MKRLKNSHILAFFLSYCMYFYDIRLMHLLIDEIGQLGIFTLYLRRNVKKKLGATFIEGPVILMGSGFEEDYVP